MRSFSIAASNCGTTNVKKEFVGVGKGAMVHGPETANPKRY